MNYQIVKKDPMQAVVRKHRLATVDSSRAIPGLWTDYFARGLDRQVCGMLGICITEGEGSPSFDYAIGCEARFVGQIPEGFEVIEIPAYTWAIFECVGSMPDAIQALWKRIYAEWLPQARYELIPGYDLEVYSDGDVHSSDYRSEIWIPVRERQD